MVGLFGREGIRALGSMDEKASAPRPPQDRMRNSRRLAATVCPLA